LTDSTANKYQLVQAGAVNITTDGFRAVDAATETVAVSTE
jgi:hypothetical protein